MILVTKASDQARQRGHNTLSTCTILTWALCVCLCVCVFFPFKTSRGGRSRQRTPGAELDGLSQGRLPSVRSHRRLYGGQPAHIRSWQSRMDPCGEDWRWGALAQGGVEGSGKVHDLLAQGRRGGQPTTCDQTRLSWSWAPHTFVGRCREWPGRCKPGGEYTPA